MKKILALTLMSLLAMACSKKPSNEYQQADSAIQVTNAQKKQVKLNNHFADDTLVTIYTHQNARSSKDLIPFLNHRNPVYREAAILAFASVQDSTLTDTLASFLKDKHMPIRRATAYALGQTARRMQAPHKVEDALLKAWETEQSKEVKIALLEAIGKAATDKGLSYLEGAKIQDEDLLYGLAMGVFRAGLKRKFNDKLTSAMVNLIEPNHQERVREMASHHLGRFGRLADLKAEQTRIIQAMASDQHPFVRMNCTKALSKINSPEVVNALVNTIKNDENYLVRVNAIRSYRFNYDSVRTAIFDAIQDKNEHVAITASQYLLNNAPKEEADTLLQIAKKHMNWNVRVNLLTLAARFAKEDNNDVSSLIKILYSKTTNVYEQGALMNALTYKLANYPWIADKMYHSKQPVLQSFAISALNKIRGLEAFKKVKEDSIKQDFGKIFKFAIESKDVGLIYYAAQALRNPQFGYKKFYKDKSFLQKTLASLKLPIDIEAYQELQKTINFFAGKPAPKSFPKETKKDIDWASIKALPQSQKVQLKTSKGNIVFKLFVNEAPVSVATFVSLVKKGFYDGKTFHRVIANFVAQGGCPRGDGFGGLDYSITSEFAPLYYREGYVGLASAGKDTESCQWFITHSPTPHLDGSYTIFARVVEGMDVVHKLQIGDKIESIQIMEAS